MLSLALLALLGQAPDPESPPVPPSPVASEAAPGNESAPALHRLTLEEALSQAKLRNLDLKATQAKLEQAYQLSKKAWSGYLPQLTVAASYTRNHGETRVTLPTGYYIRDNGTPQGPAFNPALPSGPENPPGAPTNYSLYPSGLEEAVLEALNQYSAEAQLSQALIAPVLWPSIHNAYLEQRIAQLTAENARREVLFAVAELYYGASGLAQTVSVQKRQLALTRSHERDAGLRFRAGTAPKSALLRAEIDRTQAEQDLKRAENSYRAAKVGLATMLDREEVDFEVAIPTRPALPASTAEMEEAAVRFRPDVEAARVGVDLADGQKVASWMKYLPNVGVSAVYRLSNANGFGGEQKIDAWAVTLGLNWVLFDGLLREAELKENAARKVEADAHRRLAERKAKQEVTVARLDWESAQANESKAVEALRLARENIELVNISYRSGAATYLEVEDARAALLAAELGVVGEQLNASLAALRLLKAAGAYNP